MRYAAVIAFVASCGFSKSLAGDAVDATTGNDGGDAPTMLGPWGAPTKIAMATLAGIADDPACTSDRLELYFVSDRSVSTGMDIYRMTRMTTASPWSAPQPVSELNSSSGEFAPALSPDGMTIWFSSDRSGGGGGGFDLWTATRTSKVTPFSNVMPVSELNELETDSGPDGFSLSRMTFHRITNGRRQLYEVTRPSGTGAWGTPMNLAELNTGSEDRNPHLATELELYFASQRTGGLGLHDLYVATRAAIGMPFGNVQRLDALSTSSYESSPWVAPDRRYIVFGSNVSGTSELYEASR